MQKYINAGISLLLLAGFGSATAQYGGPVSAGSLDKSAAQAQAQAVYDYWTPERMAAAQPMPTPTVTVTSTAQQPAYQAAVDLGVPTMIDGHPPGGGEYIPNVQTFPLPFDDWETQAAATPQAFGPGAANPLDYANYGKFQRWTMQGKYVRWPRSIHGKLFFDLNGGSYVCSATVANRSTIITAGHCISGGGNFGDNFLFCPSYNQGGQNVKFGCWSWTTGVTSGPWFNAGDPDYDYACIVLATTGNLKASKVGDLTGWAGRAWNFPSDKPEMTFGYPAAFPFNGTTIQQTASVDWHEWDFTAGGPKSKVIGSDLTGGSSGGGWFLSWRGPAAEIADTDGSGITDPANSFGPHINGVNSHKRCLVNCDSPPTAANGVMWQEMTSPPFWTSDTDPSDSEDIFAVCNGHANNDP